MSEAKRRSYTGAFKAKVGSEAIRGARRSTRLARLTEFTRRRSGSGRKEILEWAVALFETKRELKKSDQLKLGRKLSWIWGSLKKTPNTRAERRACKLR